MKWMLTLGCLLGGTTWSFDKDEVGKGPAAFEVFTSGDAAGQWSVVADGSNRALAQTNTTKDDRRFSMAVVKEASFTDLRLSVKARPVSGEIDQAAGLVWRLQDDKNYYLVRTNALEKNIRLYRVVNGNRIKFAGREEIMLKAGEWHTIRVEHRGDKIAVYLNDNKMFDAEDRTFDKAGKVGVWIKADSVTWFDDLTVEELK